MLYESLIDSLLVLLQEFFFGIACHLIVITNNQIKLGLTLTYLSLL